MIQMAQLSAGAKAYRNAVYKIIPSAFINKALNAAKDAFLKANEINLEESRPKLFEVFKEHGVEREDILKFLKKDSEKDVTPMDIVTMQGYYQAIKEGTDPNTIFKKSEKFSIEGQE